MTVALEWIRSDRVIVKFLRATCLGILACNTKEGLALSWLPKSKIRRNMISHLRKRSINAIALLAISLAVSLTSLQAQVTGTISGSVLDASGASVVGA